MSKPEPGPTLKLIKGSAKPARKPKRGLIKVRVNKVSVLQPGGTQKTVVSIGLPEEE